MWYTITEGVWEEAWTLQRGSMSLWREQEGRGKTTNGMSFSMRGSQATGYHVHGSEVLATTAISDPRGRIRPLPPLKMSGVGDSHCPFLPGNLRSISAASPEGAQPWPDIDPLPRFTEPSLLIARCLWLVRDQWLWFPGSLLGLLSQSLRVPWPGADFCLPIPWNMHVAHYHCRCQQGFHYWRVCGPQPPSKGLWPGFNCWMPPGTRRSSIGHFHLSWTTFLRAGSLWVLP